MDAERIRDNIIDRIDIYMSRMDERISYDNPNTNILNAEHLHGYISGLMDVLRYIDLEAFIQEYKKHASDMTKLIEITEKIYHGGDDNGAIDDGRFTESRWHKRYFDFTMGV